MFVSHWVKAVEASAHGQRKYWVHSSNPSFKQMVKPHSETYLIQAGIEGNLAFLEVYTKFKGDLGVCDQQGRSALIHAVANGHTTFVQMMCEYCAMFAGQEDETISLPDLLELRDTHGNTPLFIAVRANQPECLKLLISYRCNLFHQKKNGSTCLHECAIHNSIDCLIILASYCGQDLFSVINKEGNRAIDIAHKTRNQDVLQALQKLERNLLY